MHPALATGEVSLVLITVLFAWGQHWGDLEGLTEHVGCRLNGIPEATFVSGEVKEERSDKGATNGVGEVELGVKIA